MDVSANKGVTDDAFVVGVDFGTLSARALVVRVSDGTAAGTAVRLVRTPSIAAKVLDALRGPPRPARRSR